MHAQVAFSPFLFNIS